MVVKSLVLFFILCSFCVANSQQISESRNAAWSLYKKLVGVTPSIDDPVVIEMESYIKKKNYLRAAQIATQQPNFYNNVVRDMAAKMSNLDETVSAPLSDFVATVIGATRDNLDARTLLTGDYFYMADSSANVSSDILKDILTTNTHYLRLEAANIDLHKVLIKEKQKIRGPGNKLLDHPEPAGLLTSTSFMRAHGLAGTNRRLVEYTMREFTCLPIESWGDVRASDAFVGKDVDRSPGGRSSEYNNRCKTCHSTMDSFRGAFAKFDFAGFTRHTDTYPATAAIPADRVLQKPSGSGVVRKYNAIVIDPNVGYETKDNNWVNMATSDYHMKLFGWRGNYKSGNGLRSFAVAVANSKAFSGCMARRVFKELCRREVSNEETSIVKSLAANFEKQNYNLRSLFEEVAIRPECLSKGFK